MRLVMAESAEQATRQPFSRALLLCRPVEEIMWPWLSLFVIRRGAQKPQIGKTMTERLQNRDTRTAFWQAPVSQFSLVSVQDLPEFPAISNY